MLLIRIVKKSFIKKLRSVSKNWKVLICELTGRNFLYIYFGAANFTYQLELDGFGPNAIKIVKLIKINFTIPIIKLQNHNTDHEINKSISVLTQSNPLTYSSYY